MEKHIRKSNIELFRIILMLIIIAHHYVVNSGISTLYNYSNITGNMIFLQIFGFGGKMAINCFLLISGYFMINSQYELKKFIKLYVEIKFYKIILYIFFVILGYETFNLKTIFKCIFSVIYSIAYGRSFPEVYLMLFLLIPYINVLIKAIDKKSITQLIVILLFYFSIISTLFPNLDTIHYLGWFITVYMIGAYIRLYPTKYTGSIKFGLWGAITSFAFIVVSILLVDYCRSIEWGNIKNYYYWAVDSHKITCITCAICLFIVFKNIDVKYNKCINTLASSTFGILLIHANSNSMRTFLWERILKCTTFYESSWFHYMLFVPFWVYI